MRLVVANARIVRAFKQTVARTGLLLCLKAHTSARAKNKARSRTPAYMLFRKEGTETVKWKRPSKKKRKSKTTSHKVKQRQTIEYVSTNRKSHCRSRY